MAQRWFPTPLEGARPCLIKRDGGAKCPIWRRIRHRIFCATTCVATNQLRTPPDSIPPREEERTSEEVVGGGFTPKADGGNEQHPIHDEDQEDTAPDDYEREIDRLDEAVRARLR